MSVIKPHDFSKDAENTLPVILSVAGEVLTDDEKALFSQSNPLGFILFQRNCKTPEQLSALNASLKETVGRECPVLIDQEGGRVARLKPPHWSEYPACKIFGDKAEINQEEALSDLRYRTLRIADDLASAGINVNCDPVMDIAIEGAHDVIGDRAFSADPSIVGRLGLSVCRHYLSAGITPIIKHIPGHGRADLDSHDVAPVINATAETLEKTDFIPFKVVAKSEVAPYVWAMPSPVIYSAYDETHPACVSSVLIEDVIRKEIGFKGIVISDALDMGGFSNYGSQADRVQAVLKAGCDIALYCKADINDMRDIVEKTDKISDAALSRLQAASSKQDKAA